MNRLALGTLAAVLAVAAGCHETPSAPLPPPGLSEPPGVSPPPEVSPPPGSAATAVLTAGQPAARIPIRPPPRTHVGRGRITEIANPTRRGLVLAAPVPGPQGVPVEIGRASVYPADRPAAFQFPLRGAATASDTVLVVSVAADPATASLPKDLRLVIEVEVIAR